MKLTKLLKISFLELTRYKSVTAFLVANLCFGLIGFFLIQIFQQSLSQQTAEKAQVILGGDLAISARRTFNPQEIKAFEKEFQYEKKSHMYSLFTMLRTKVDSKLVNVVVFDDQYPLYGQYKFSDVPGFLADKPYVWVDPEIQEVLNLKLDEKISIGESQFIFAGTIVEDPSRILGTGSFAPQVLIHEKYFLKAGLLKPGSTLTESYFYKITNNENLKPIQNKIYKLINDPFVRVKIFSENDENSSRVVQYFTDYLGLVALVALGLCFLCGSYLLQWIFLTKKKTIAIYKTLGLSDVSIIFVNLLQSLLISIVASLLGLILVRLSLPTLQSLILNKFQLTLNLFMAPKAVLITCLLAVMGPLVMVIPQLIQMVYLKPLTLLQNFDTANYKKQKSYFVWISIICLLFWALSIWQSHSFKIGSIFVVSILGLIIVFNFINRLMMIFLEKISVQFGWLIRYSIKGLTRKRGSTSLVFTTMSLATLVLSLLPHLKSSIIHEVKPENKNKLPALFMFDIQPEQTDFVKKAAYDILGQEIVLSPLVRSRILKVNEKPYERVQLSDDFRSREEEENARFRNRGINLTYRDFLQDSETLIEGKHQTVVQDEKPLISLEKRYAGRMGINLGDKVTFDIQGVEVKAQVGSLRQVRWTSFQPNFFILFPNGVLEEAPQVFLTAIMNPGTDNFSKKIKEFQLSIAQKFSNISIIDVRKTVESSLKYIDQMSWGLQLMAWLAVLMGVLVFFVLLNTQIKERVQEMNLLQILGTSSKQVFEVVIVQFVLLILVSVVFGILLGLISAHILISVIFDITTIFDFVHLGLLMGVLVPVVVLALYWGLKPLKKLNPMDLIRQG